jgi:hypothetical protein
MKSARGLPSQERLEKDPEIRTNYLWSSCVVCVEKFDLSCLSLSSVLLKYPRPPNAEMMIAFCVTKAIWCLRTRCGDAVVDATALLIFLDDATKLSYFVDPHTTKLFVPVRSTSRKEDARIILIYEKQF